MRDRARRGERSPWTESLPGRFEILGDERCEGEGERSLLRRTASLPGLVGLSGNRVILAGRGLEIGRPEGCGERFELALAMIEGLGPERMITPASERLRI